MNSLVRRLAKRSGNSTSLVVALAWGASVFLWTGDFESAEEYIDLTIYQAESNSMGPFVAVGRTRKAELAIRRGDAKNGVESLRACLERDDFSSNRHPALSFCLSMIFFGKPVSTFPDHALEAIHAVGSELLTTEFNISLVQGLAEVGQFAECITLVDNAIRRVETNGDDLYMPELLRVKGGILLCRSGALTTRKCAACSCSH